MKYFLLTLFALFYTISCTPKALDNIGGTVIECRFTDIGQGKESPSDILKILTDRLKYQKRATNPTVIYNDTTGVFRIEIPGVTDVNVAQLVSHGRMSVCEVYTVSDVESAIDKALSDTLFQQVDFSLDRTIYSANVFLTGVKQSDQLLIDSFLESSRGSLGFPPNLIFCWGWDVEYDSPVAERYTLYMIKDIADNIDLVATHKSSSIEKYGPASYESIGIKLNDLGAEKFAQLTERNIGFPLAIVGDNRVLSAPNVMSKIERGSLVISGAFSKNYLEGLLGLLNSGVIESDAEIISVDVKGDKEAKIKRPRV